ncbi:MAG TPA: response regulator [Candidatus Binataceae bacterium]|nr:response regulator [Candidatus Binataceae bacterium]
MEADLILLHRKTVMVIDDDAENRATVADLLELNGYLVTQAANGSDALAQLKLGAPPPALILLDLIMPVMDGRAFIRRTRSRSWLARVPIVVMAEDPKPVPAITAAVAILKKPFAGNTLLNCVNRYAAATATPPPLR